MPSKLRKQNAIASIITLFARQPCRYYIAMKMLQTYCAAVILFLNCTLLPSFATDSGNDNIQFKLHQSTGEPATTLEANIQENNIDEEISPNQEEETVLNPAGEETSIEAKPASETKYGEIVSDEKPDGANQNEQKPLAGSSPTKPAVKLLQGKIAYTVPSGTPIKLKLAAVPTHVIRLMDRDMEGNLYPAQVGQIITAKTSDDIYVDENKVIPEGTVFSGKVTEVLPPRRVGRPGSLILSFDQLTTPDGHKFAFRAQANNFRASTLKTKAKGFGIIAAHAAGGAIVGALVAYELFGMENTIAMHGYNIAGGAAAGALIATGFAIMRKGPKATLEPGDDLNMTIDNDLLMPVALPSKTATQLAELNHSGLILEIEKSKIVNDGVGGKFVTIDATATNDTDHDLSSIDLFLEDTNSDRHPVCSSPDENSQFLFHLEPHSTQHLHMSFLTPYPKLKQELVWLDHDTKLVIAREKVK